MHHLGITSTSTGTSLGIANITSEWTVIIDAFSLDSTHKTPAHVYTKRSSPYHVQKPTLLSSFEPAYVSSDLNESNHHDLWPASLFPPFCQLNPNFRNPTPLSRFKNEHTLWMTLLIVLFNMVLIPSKYPHSTLPQINQHNTQPRCMSLRKPQLNPLTHLQSLPTKSLPIQIELQIMRHIDHRIAFRSHRIKRMLKLLFMY